MIKYEDFSSEVKHGIENFKKALPKILEDVEPIRNRWNDYVSGGPFEEFSFKDRKIKWTPTICSVFASFCLAAGSTFDEAQKAVEFARSKNYWLGPMESKRLICAETGEVEFEYDYAKDIVIFDKSHSI